LNGRTGKASTIDILHAMVWNEKALLPPHEHSAAITVLNGHEGPLCLVAEVLESWKTGPMNQILVLGCSPVLGQKSITATNDLGVKIGCEFWPVVCEAADPEIAAERGLWEIDVLDRIRNGR